MSCDTLCTLSLPALIGGERAAQATPPLTVERYAHSEELPAREWDQLTAHAPCLSRAQLAALERSPEEGARHILALRREGLLVGAALLRDAPFHAPSVADIIHARAPRAAQALRALRVGARPMDARVLVCGGGAAAQGPALYIAPGVDRAQALRALGEEARRLTRSSRGGRPLLAVLFHGAPPAHAGAPSALAGLAAAGYARFDADPSLSLTLDPRWGDFEGYLSALSSKYRVKAKRADALSAELVAQPLDAAGARRWRRELIGLYEQVTRRADFCARSAEVDALPELLEAQPRRYRLSAYCLGEALVGFRLSLLEGETLYAQLVGIDYAHSRAHGLYPRMLNDYIREGLALGCRAVDFGRAAGEIKSTLGATPSATELYIAHAHPLVHLLLPSIARRVTPAPHKQHQPFRAG